MDFLPARRTEHIEQVRVIGPSDGGGYSFQTQRGDVYHGKSTIVGGHQSGDLVRVGYLSGMAREPVILEGWQAGVIRHPKIHAFSQSIDLGIWPTSQGPINLDHLSRVVGSPQQEFPSANLIAAGPSVGGADLLGLVAFSLPSEETALAIYARLDAGGGNLQNVLFAYRTNGSLVWTASIGDVYPIPGVGTQENAVGDSQTWLAYDATAKSFWVVGHGTTARRKQIWIVRNDGTVGPSYNLGALASQSTAGATAFVKGWHSRRGTTGREEDHPNLVGVTWNGDNYTSWNLDPQSLLNGLQIATSAVEVRGDAICPEGRWPINSDGLMLFWLSGSRPNVNGKINVILELYQTGGSADDMCAAANAAVAADSRTQEHRGCICAINAKTGQLAWRREWQYNATHTLDSNAYNGWLALFPSPAPGDIGLQYFNFRGLVDSSYANTYSFSGLASALSLNLAPITVSDLPGCSISNPGDPPEEHIPVYSPGSEIIFPWFGPGWGSGAGAQFQMSACGEWIGPVYDWFEPGHPCLLPLPQIPGFGDQGPSQTWPVNQHTTRLDPVGGTMSIDSNKNVWHAHLVQSGPVLDDFKLQLQYAGHTEVFVPPTLETQCGQWTSRQLQWHGYAVGIPSHHPILRLCCTGPTGSAVCDVDITQKFKPIVYGGGPSSIDRGVLANVWQIVPIPTSRVVIVLRDWFAQFTDGGGLENLPYPVIEVRDYQDPTTVLQRIMLTEDLSIYNSESDPELEPVWRRRIDQYSNQSTLSAGKGGATSNGHWVQWSHLVRNRESETDICNRVQLLFVTNNQTPTVNRWNTTGQNIPDSQHKCQTAVVLEDKMAWIDGAQGESGYFVTVVS